MDSTFIALSIHMSPTEPDGNLTMTLMIKSHDNLTLSLYSQVVLPGGKEEPLDVCATYNLAASDYIFGGGDGYTVLAGEGHTVIGSSAGQVCGR